MLENEASRKALIEQLRQAAATPADQPTPVIKPPVNNEEDKTVLENVTEVTRHYGGEFAGRFAQLHRNITNAPHKPFNEKTFFNALSHFSLLAVSVFLFYFAVR
ncbi:mechanosensitive channel protein, partial [Cronobacter sakazakii]